MSIQWWNYTPCKNTNKLSNCRAHNAVIVSQMVRLIGRFITICIITIQCFYLINKPIMPVLGTGAIVGATFGYIFLNQIYEVVAGMMLLFSNDIRIGDNVVLHIAFTDPSPPMKIENFHLLYIETSYQDKETQETQRLYAYYSKILQIVKI